MNWRSDRRFASSRDWNSIPTPPWSLSRRTMRPFTVYCRPSGREMFRGTAEPSGKDDRVLRNMPFSLRLTSLASPRGPVSMRMSLEPSRVIRMDDRFSRERWAMRKLIFRRITAGSSGLARQQSIRPLLARSMTVPFEAHPVSRILMMASEFLKISLRKRSSSVPFIRGKSSLTTRTLTSGSALIRWMASTPLVVV